MTRLLAHHEDMSKLGTFAKRYPFVFTTLLVGTVVLSLWLGGLGLAAQVTASIYVSLFIAWTAVGMVKDILKGNFGLDILAVVAMGAALAVGEYGASIVVVLMLSGGEALEDYAASRAKMELSSLVNRVPQTAQLILNPGESAPKFKEVPADDVVVGDQLLVRPGQVVPVDATLLSEEASFDESSITGESLPVMRAAGEEVLSGAVNGETACVLRALRPASQSQYQQIVSLVQESEKQKAPVVRVADRFAVPFTIVSLVIAGAAWIISGDPVRFAEVLVLATPCPLLIAAPVAFMGGTSRAAKNGIIVKGGAVLESLARVRSAGFDKTGTVTLGRPDVSSVVPATEFEEGQLLGLAASVEQYSSHVLGEAIVRAARADGAQLLEADQVRELPGAGIEGTVAGRVVSVSNAKYMATTGAKDVPLLRSDHGVVAYVVIDGHYAGRIVLNDEIRPDSAAVVDWLRKNGVEKIAMLTGDNQPSAQLIADEAGITDVYADLKPREKVQRVRELKPKPSMMVGDGVNDAPALAVADIGIAMGARGATAAGEAADAVIMADQISKVADAVSISKHTLQVGLTSIWLGVILSVALMLVATTGVIPAMAGALTQEFVDLAAILYALRALGGSLPVLRKKDERVTEAATAA